jgi:hypothetical protein
LEKLKLRWLENVENDLRELKPKRLKQKENNREERTCVVNEAEVLSGP